MPASQLQQRDDLRHPPASGEKGRDSLFFSVMLPEHDLGLHVYTWVDERGRAGRLLAVWGPDPKPVAFEVVTDVAMGDADFDDWRVEGLEIRHPEPLRTAELRYAGKRMTLACDFAGTHDAFDYAQNAIGCPQWMAINRIEQTGHVRGELRLGGRVIDLDHPAHRDHSWGHRDWKVPQHWKWVAAQTPSGAGLNLFQWVAKGELGTNGYVLRDGVAVGLVNARCHAEYDADMTSRTLTATLSDEAGGVTELVLERFGHLGLPVGSDVICNETACRGTIDGEPAAGQFEAQWPAAYVRHLAAEA